jgi:hypothetical protein
MASAKPSPEIRMGLVAYRDRGDSYVTRVVDPLLRLDSMYATLMDFQADAAATDRRVSNQRCSTPMNKVS